MRPGREVRGERRGESPVRLPRVLRRRLQRGALRAVAVPLHQGDVVVDPGAAAPRHQLHLTPGRQVTARCGEHEAPGVPVECGRDRGLARADAGPAVLGGRVPGVAARYGGFDALPDELERAGGRGVQFPQVLPRVVEGDPGAQPFGEVGVQRGRGQRLDPAQGAGGEVGAGLVTVRAVVGEAVGVLLAGLDHCGARIEAPHLPQQRVGDVLAHRTDASPGDQGVRASRKPGTDANSLINLMGGGVRPRRVPSSRPWRPGASHAPGRRSGRPAGSPPPPGRTGAAAGSRTRPA